MKIKTILLAGTMGVAAFAALPEQLKAQTLTTMESPRSDTLEVPMNRAVVVESDVPFAELSIANPGIADISTLSDRTVYILGKAPGRTTLTLLGPDGRLIMNVDVAVTPDVAEFKERLRQILPGERIEVRTANDGIVLSGSVSSTARLDRALELARRYAGDKVSNLMTVGGTQQVMLKVRFAEMQRSVSKELSGSLGFIGADVLGAGNNIDGTNALINPPRSITTEKTGALGVGFSAGGVEFGILLEALESKGMVRTLAEPNLTALSGQEAEFLAGGEYPIPVVGDEGSITIEYKPFGVQLGFLPRVVDGDIINLAITAAVSGVDDANSIQTSDAFAVNAFKRREAKTTVEMRDGESFAIAGLLQDDFSDLNGQVPWLGDIPVLGALFRSSEYQRAQSELVIIVTPHLVTPTRGEALALPTERVRPPTEADLFLRGRTYRTNKGAAAEVARQDFTGSYGYVME